MQLQFLTAKDVMSLTSTSKSHAYRLISDIKEEYNLKTKITKEHLLKYLNLHTLETKDVP